MGKAFAAFVAIAVVGLIVFVLAGGFLSFDPAADAEKFVQTVKPGMSWKQVLALAKPGKWMRPTPATQSGISPPKKFDPDEFEQILKDTGTPNGFIWQYTFTSEHSYDVWFSPAGNVVEVTRPVSMGDLLKGKLPG